MNILYVCSEYVCIRYLEKMEIILETSYSGIFEKDGKIYSKFKLNLF